MKDLIARILAIYPDINLMFDVTVQDDSDGKGQYIAAWLDPRPQPTEAELLAVAV